MDKKPLEVKSYNVEDERRFKDLTARVVSLEYWRGAAQADMVKRIKALEQWMDDSKDRPDGCTEADLRFLERSNSDVWPRITALEARCHHLEHDRAAGVQSQIADLQERVGCLENEHSREVRYIPVDDHRDAERPLKPAPMMACPGDGTEHCQQCPYHQAHRQDDACDCGCRPNKASPIRCQPVPASPEVAIPDLITLDSMAHMEPEPDPDVMAKAARWLGSAHAEAEEKAADALMQPIPDVPTSVGTEAFRRELQRHAEELSQGYGYQGRMDAALMGIDEPWERLAGVACTLRDAYELARTGETEAAQEKLEEITW